MFMLQIDDALSLRLLDEGTVEDMFRLIAANRAHLSAHLAWPAEHQTVADTRRFMQLTRRAYGKERRIGAAIYHNGQMVGGMGLRIEDAQLGTAEIG